MFSVTDEGIACEIPIEIGLSVSPQNGCGSPDQRPNSCSVANLQILKEMLQLKAKGKEHPETPETSKTDLLSSRPARNWHVIRLETNLEKADPLQSGPGR